MLHINKFFLVTDFGFIVYWLATALHLIPLEYAYSDYTNPIIVSWNWSFFPLDMLVSLTGLWSLFQKKREREQWRFWALCSLIMTFASGFVAISFWIFSHDFNLTWWIPNLYLVLYPIFFIRKLFSVFKV